MKRKIFEANNIRSNNSVLCGMGDTIKYNKTIYCRAQAKHSNSHFGIVEESDFSDTAYNSAYVSGVQSWITKSTFATIV